MRESAPLSKFTIFFSLYIVISASFMLQLNNFLINILGQEKVKFLFFCLFYSVSIFYTTFVIFKTVNIIKAFLSVFVFAIAYVLISKQQLFAEKFHVLEYGILGYLALRDITKANSMRFINILYALFFAVLVSFADEGFQKLLPYRVCDIKDVITNAISGLLGIFLYCII